MISRSLFSLLHGWAMMHVNMSATFCSTRSYAGETPTCRTPSHACRPPLRKQQLRAHILDDPLLFSESTCETVLETFTQVSNVTLLSQATWASRDSSHSSCPNPRDRQQQQQQPQRQPHRSMATSRQCQPFRGKNRSLPQSSTKKGGVAAKINID